MPQRSIETLTLRVPPPQQLGKEFFMSQITLRSDPWLPTAHDRNAIRLKSATVAVASVILIGGLFRLFAGYAVGLGFGESYHFSCARHVSLSYFDHPPMSLWMGYLSMWIVGDVGPLALRGPFIAMFAGTTWLIYAIGSKLFCDWAGYFAALLVNLSAVFSLSVATFLQSDGPLVFFSLLCVACLVKIFFDDAPGGAYRWWCGVGSALGLAMLSKYHAVFLVFGAGMFALTTQDGRKWVRHPGPYVAIAIAAIVFAPVLIWNHQHAWISFLWQGNRGLEGSGLRLDWLARNIGGQALWLLPWIWLPLLAELFYCFRAGARSKARWFVAWMAVAPIVLFTFVSAYAPIGFHFHWQAPGYLLLFLALGDTVERRLSRQSKLVKWWLGGSVAFTCLSLVALTTHAATGWWREIGPQWLSQKFGEPDDPTLEGLDYATLPNALAERGLMGRPNTFLFTNRWFQSGKVDYALKGTMPVLCFHGVDPRSYAFFDRPEDWIGQDGILVSTKKFLSDPAGEYSKYFESFEPLGTVAVPRGRFVEETLHLYFGRRHHTPFPRPYQ